MLTALQAPSWLPYRIRSAFDSARIERAVRRIKFTRPITTAEPDHALAEVFMLICRRDASIAIVALKSLLRFFPGQLAVTISDDGSLTSQQREQLFHHFPNARWLTRYEETAVIDRLDRDYPRVGALYRSPYHPICKLVYPILIPRVDRVIVLDPDTAFFQRPETIACWMGSEARDAYYLHDHQDEQVQVPSQVREAFVSLAQHLEQTGPPWRLDRLLFNSGLLVYRPSQMNLAYANEYLHWRDHAPTEWKSGKAAIWFGDWTPEQTCYLAMYAKLLPPAIPLGDDYHLGGGSGHVFNHFLRHYLIQPNTLYMLQRLIATLD